jgi:2,5-diketo-D-gluconate reductase A
MSVPYITLNNAIQIPQLGLGVWQAQEGQEVERAVRTALETGYRLIDTAAIYGNEGGVGKAIRESAIPREDIFLTTKLWNANHATADAIAAFETSLSNLGCEYIDLYLIHWPVPMDGLYIEAWHALEKLYAQKRVRAIGVSNFKPIHLQTLLAEAEVVPAVNQIELHPRLQQRETREICAEHTIAIESYSPLMQGGELFEDPTIVRLASEHDKTPAQIILRWHIQNGFIVIPKSVTPSRIKENFEVFDFELSDDDMQSILKLDAGQRIGADPDTASFK